MGYVALYQTLVAFDLPISAVADTLVLPFDKSRKENKQQPVATAP
jgi:uncharacterized protein YceK